MILVIYNKKRKKNTFNTTTKYNLTNLHSLVSLKDLTSLSSAFHASICGLVLFQKHGETKGVMKG